MCEIIPDDNSLFYFETHNFTGKWTSQEDPDFSQPVLLSSEDIRKFVLEISEAYSRIEEWRVSESFNVGLTKIQSTVRMFIQKKRYNKKLAYLNSQEESVIIIQSFYRGWRVRKEMRNKKNKWHKATKEIVKIQSVFRMIILRKRD